MQSVLPSLKSIAVLSVGALLAVGCASRPRQTLNVDSLQLGTTSASSLSPVLGTPASTSNQTNAAGTRTVSVYEPRWGVDLIHGGAIELDTAVIESLNDRLQGYFLVGPLIEGHERITPDTGATITPGRTVASELIARFGPPLGRALPGTRLFNNDDHHSMNTTRAAQRLVWLDSEDGRHGLLRHEVNHRLLMVDVDANDHVISAETTQWTQMVPMPR